MRLLVELALRVRDRDAGGAVRVVLALPMSVVLAAAEVRVIDEVRAGGIAVPEGDRDPVDDTDGLELGEGEVVLLTEGPDDNVAVNDGEAVGVAVNELVSDGVGSADIVALLDAVDICDSVPEGVPDIERVRS